MTPASVPLDALFRPRSIAVIGASRTPGKNGHAVVQNLVRGGYAGRIFPVNPAGGAIEGIACYRSLAELPEPADCAMVVIPAADAVAAVRQCAAAGIRAVVVGATGFAEDGTAAGAARQEALAQIARESGLVLLGPNTNGFLNATDRVSLGYNAEHAEHFPPGGVSVVSHSGALFGGVARTLRRLGGGLSKFIPVGNEAGVTMLDVLAYLIADEATAVIGLVVEALGDGDRLRDLAARARQAAKPIVALKVGRSAVGAEATMAHSSRLAGRARAYDALFAACGIATVGSVEALAGGCAVLAGRTAPVQAGAQGLVCVTTSGAGGALLADAAAQRGLALEGDGTGEWQGAVGAAIRALPSRGRLRNPIDTGSFGGGWAQLDDIYALLESAGITGPTAVYAHIAPHPDMDAKLAAALIERRRRTAGPIVVMAPGGLTAAIEARYIAAGIPVFHDLATGFDSLRCHYATLPPHPNQLPVGEREISASPGALWRDRQHPPHGRCPLAHSVGACQRGRAAPRRGGDDRESRLRHPRRGRGHRRAHRLSGGAEGAGAGCRAQERARARRARHRRCRRPAPPLPRDGGTARRARCGLHRAAAAPGRAGAHHWRQPRARARPFPGGGVGRHPCRGVGSGEPAADPGAGRSDRGVAPILVAGAAGGAL